MTVGPLLAARAAGRRFREQTALLPVELELWDGEALALVGPAGAGKSTLLALLAGALEPSTGRIERRKGVRVGWAPQRPAQYGGLSARENLELFARLEGEPDAPVAAERLLDAFELPDEPVASAELSAGERQRLNLAIGLLASPQVLLLDEPAAELTAAQRQRLWTRAAALRESGGAVIIATQNLEDVELIADRVAALRDGRLVFTGPLDDYRRSSVETLSA